MEPDDRDWLTASEAVARLGVKPQTLYAYVSRGLVRRERVPGTRASRYLRADVARLAARAARPGREGGPEIVVDSALTLIDPAGRLAYRGWDVAEAAMTASYEDVAEWLWETADEARATPWAVPREAGRIATRVQAALPRAASIPDRLRVSAVAIAAGDPLRDDRRPDAVAARARGLIATLVASLPIVDGARDAPPGASIAARLWPRLSAAAPSPARIRALDTALVALADHELAASTLAVRVAASTWADPYLLVSAGLAAAGGPLHGGASEQVRALLREVVDGTPAPAAVGRRLREHGGVPGFGHAVYEGPDPRAPLILAALGRTRPARAVGRAVAEVADVVSASGGPHPNVDFALGALAEAHHMVPGAGEAIFVVARAAGWIAHGLEEYRHRLRYRIRAAYTGPEPEWVAGAP